MVRISKFKLQDEAYERIYDLFCQVLMHNRKKKDFQELLSDVLTPSEQITIAKRVALFYLLQRKVPTGLISETLHLSQATISSWALVFRRTNRINKTFSAISKQRKITDLLEDIIADMLIQPGFLKGHWRQYWQEQQRRQRKITGGL